MFPLKDEKDVAKLLHCLSILEHKIYEFYKCLHEKVEHQFVKSLLLYVAYDSQKHSVILKEQGANITNLEKKIGDCEEELGVVWKTVVSLPEEISKEGKLDDKRLFSLVNRLADFENVMSEEYVTLIWLKILEFMTKEMPKIHGIDSESLKIIFRKIAEDEEGHREILLLIKGFLQEKNKKWLRPVLL